MTSVFAQRCGLCQKSILVSDVGRKERLTRCRGHTFLVQSIREGIIKNENGDDVPADFLISSQLRGNFSCGVHDGDYYFHQSCVGREMGAALSYDVKLVVDKAGERRFELANFAHLLCPDCAIKAQQELGGELPSELSGPKYQSLSGTLQLCAASRCQ